MPTRSPVSCVFLDVGNVLMDETPWLGRHLDLMFEATRARVPGLTRAAFMVGSAEARAAGEHRLAPWFPGEAERRAVREDYWSDTVRAYYELGRPPEGIWMALDALRGRFHLGIIANQHPPVREWLARTGLAPYFGTCVLDCDEGVSKPDARLFGIALDRAGCRPEQAIMVGDRLDNDIRPARSLGMWTIRLRAYGDYTGPEPTEPADTPDVTVDDVAPIPAAVEEICRLADER